jgi:tetratricopeptide (TPR) repeat protein
MKPICFAIMPFGKKKVNGEEVDFDNIYNKILKPAIEKAEMIPIREDEELSGGIIHKTMIEKIIFSDFVLVDTSMENVNVFYELGIRHMASKNNTLLISFNNKMNVFDISPVRYYFYDKNDINEIGKIAKKISEIHNKEVKTSPIYDFFDFEIDKTKYKDKIESFKEKSKKINELEEELLIAKAKKDIQKLEELEDKVIFDNNLSVKLYITYRDLKKYEKMLNFYEKLKNELKENKFILQQYAFALNRLGRREESEITLKKIIEKFGEDSETMGILGRIYKDLWEEKNNNSYLKKAIDVYKKGFEADLNDYYPGINLLTLALYDGNKEILDKYLPIVEVAVEKSFKNKKDYWGVATKLEVAFIKQDCKLAKKMLEEIIFCDKEKWMLETTLKNLTFLMDKIDNQCLENIKNELENLIKGFER